jgi:peptidoglycan/LPS O-acetylase OafA/YrhL
MDLLERRVISVLDRNASLVLPSFTVNDIRRIAHDGHRHDAESRRLAFDGLRGIAVALVVAFHHGYSWARGGFIGVSVFFTLSGWLIANQVVMRPSRPTFATFVGRRARRLLPAALTTIAATLVLIRLHVFDAPGSAADALASTFSVSNWRFATSGRSYAALFSSPSPFQQFWSLSVEEQFYLGFGACVAIAGRRGRAAVHRVIRFAVPLSVALFAFAPVAHHLVGSATYYWTPIRLAEIGIGVGLAGTRRVRKRPGTRLMPEVQCAAGLLVIAGASMYARVDSFWLHLWLPAVAIGTGTLIDALCRQEAVLADRILTHRLLVHAGIRSYAIYLVHWPVFLALNRSSLRVSGNTLFAVRGAAVVVLAELLHRFVEEPARRSRALAGPARARIAAAVAITAVVALAATMPAAATYNLQEDLDRARAELPLSPDGIDVSPAVTIDSTSVAGAPATEPPSAAPASPILEPPAAPQPIRVATFGDSTMLRTAWGLQVWGRASGRLDIVGGVSELGCGIARDGDRRHDGRIEVPNQVCIGWADSWPASIAGRDVSVAIVQAGPWDVLDRRLPGSQRWLSPGDPSFDGYLADEIGAAMDVLMTSAPHVVWLTSPTLYFDLTSASGSALPESNPNRVAIFNRLARSQAASRPGVAIVELGDYIDGLDRRGSVADLRPDGVHFSDRSAPTVAAWLGPEIMHAAHLE